ncbi:hypothetical protein HT746_01835 [Burkholderia pyrrocinia]|nr:hypothetical protein [Burkholderia pyrrocinia]NTX25897.1 hypothetical protein [Burkholderia pyrrocinia]
MIDRLPASGMPIRSIVSEPLTAPLDCAPYVRNSGFTPGQISRVPKLKRC